MTNMTSIPMCRRGTMAFMMEFNTICKPDEASAHFKMLHVGWSTGTWIQKQTATSDKRTWHSRYEPKRSQHPERSEGFDIQASGFPCGVMGLSWLVIRHGFCYHTEQPAQTHTQAVKRLPETEHLTVKRRQCTRPQKYPTMTITKSRKFHPLRM